MLLSFICFSCRKDGKHCEGEATVFLNGEEWRASSTMNPDAQLDNYFRIKFLTFDDLGDVEKKLSISNIPYKVGKYYLYRSNLFIGDSLTTVSLSQYLEGDQQIGAWGLEEDPDSANYVDISFYDEWTGEVEGTFNFTLSGRTIFTYERDTLRFTDGWFEGRICDDD